MPQLLPEFDQIIAIPNKVLYDMTRNSDNMKKVRAKEVVNSHQQLASAHLMSDLSDADCAAIQKEMRKKNARWVSK